MAHTTSYPDYTDHILNNSALLVSVKQTLIRTFRALSGKCVLPSAGATTFNATTPVAVSGLNFRVRANKMYRIKGTLLVTCDVTSGSKIGLSLAGSSAATGQIVYRHNLATTMSTQQTIANVLATNETGLAGLTLSVDIDGQFIPDVSGLLNVVAGTLTGTTAGTINVGSNVAVYRVRG